MAGPVKLQLKTTTRFKANRHVAAIPDGNGGLTKLVFERSSNGTAIPGPADGLDAGQADWLLRNCRVLEIAGAGSSLASPRGGGGIDLPPEPGTKPARRESRPTMSEADIVAVLQTVGREEAYDVLVARGADPALVMKVVMGSAAEAQKERTVANAKADADEPVDPPADDDPDDGFGGKSKSSGKKK
jgi:hypothetical protein